jgi:hypothetical protein
MESTTTKVDQTNMDLREMEDEDDDTWDKTTQWLPMVKCLCAPCDLLLPLLLRARIFDQRKKCI